MTEPAPEGATPPAQPEPPESAEVERACALVAEGLLHLLVLQHPARRWILYQMEKAREKRERDATAGTAGTA